MPYENNFFDDSTSENIRCRNSFHCVKKDFYEFKIKIIFVGPAIAF